MQPVRPLIILFHDNGMTKVMPVFFSNALL